MTIADTVGTVTPAETEEAISAYIRSYVLKRLEKKKKGETQKTIGLDIGYGDHVTVSRIKTGKHTGTFELPVQRRVAELLHDGSLDELTRAAVAQWEKGRPKKNRAIISQAVGQLSLEDAQNGGAYAEAARSIVFKNSRLTIDSAIELIRNTALERHRDESDID